MIQKKPALPALKIAAVVRMSYANTGSALRVQSFAWIRTWSAESWMVVTVGIANLGIAVIKVSANVNLVSAAVRRLQAITGWCG